MNVDYIKIFGKNEQELENLTQTIRIYNEDIMEFGLKNVPCL